MPKRNAKIVITILVIATLGYVLYQFYFVYVFGIKSPYSNHAYDVSRRFSSPDGTKTVLLVRDYEFDLNFKLFVVEKPNDSPPRFTSKSYLWISRDYNPETDQNFHEDLEWSDDSSVIAVIIEGEYVFAYDFNFEKEYKDNGEIKLLIESRSNP